MNALIRWSIRYRGFVALLSVVWLLAGIFLAMRAPLDVFPEFVPPQVTIQTEAPGLAPEQVEQIITRPIEAAVIGGSRHRHDALGVHIRSLGHTGDVR